jgi:hypothetical protein
MLHGVYVVAVMIDDDNTVMQLLVLIVIFIAVCEYNADELVSFTGTCITPV